ncbi:MAG: hypothetical protein GXP39_01980 [Chloroflexi bacterium]|nr:hypothetical protein [Chloroflexota bacterium]
MNTKTVAVLGLKLLILTALLFVLFSVSSLVVGLEDTDQAVDQTSAAAALLVVCALHTAILSYLILRSRWTGWRLVATIFVIYYGVMTFLSQIETVVFLKYLVSIIPAEMIPRLFAQGILIAAPFSPLAVLILGKMKGTEIPEEPDRRLDMPWTGWGWRLLLIGVIYLVIYISFGMFVFRPLAGEAFDEYYANLQMPAWILPFQIVRGMVWGLLALLIVRMLRGPWRQAELVVALSFSILMGSLLLIPSGIMPDVIRHAHLVEVTTSNFAFGWIAAWLLHIRQRPRAQEEMA